MELPSSLPIDVAVWMRTQMTIAAARAVEPVRAEVERVDDWANGLFNVLLSVLPYLVARHPELARQLAPQWREAADRFDRLAEGDEPAEDGETLELLEAPKMLYRQIDLMHLWPDQASGAAHIDWLQNRRRA